MSHLERIPQVTEFDWDEHGVWCPHCGDLIAAPWNIDEDWQEPNECRACGFPEDLEKMAEVMC